MGCSNDKSVYQSSTPTVQQRKSLEQKKTRNKDVTHDNSYLKGYQALRLSNNIVNTHIEGGEILIEAEMLVNENKEDVLKYYTPIQKIGQGSFGKVFKVKQIATGHIFAMKVVEKSNILYQDGNKKFLQEIAILRKLDHPNILKIFEYFVNEKYYYVIMEFVAGGELYQQIYEMQYYDEGMAARLMKQIFSCVSYLHQMGVVHRDLKPENMMLTNKKGRAEIKLIDFGTANYVKDNQRLTLQIGSPFFIAPEVIKKNYGKECDLWSCGIILHILLVGYPPFDGKTTQEILLKIDKGGVNLNSEDWANVTCEARDLISQLLQKSPFKRISAMNGLKHPWILQNTDSSTNTNIKGISGNFSLKNCLRNFSSKQKLHQASVAFIVHQMASNDMIKQLTEIFKQLDESGEGLLSKQELKKGYKKFFVDSITDKEFEEIMETIDQDKSGQISIEEFLRATLNYENLVTEKNLKYAFDYFDKDHSGKLSPDEVKEVLGITGNDQKTKLLIDEIMNEVDLNGDGEICYEEFKQMMVSDKIKKHTH